MTDSTPNYNSMQIVKRQFFAMRNGVIADALRKAGSPFRFIFGVNLPQLRDIAAQVGQSAELAEQLWANTATRESMLIAPMIQPEDNFTLADAERWIATIPAAEVADVLCLKLLRRQPYALELIDRLIERADAEEGTANCEMLRYTALRLMFNLVGEHPAKAREVAARIAARPSRLTVAVAASLTQEADYLLEN